MRFKLWCAALALASGISPGSRSPRNHHLELEYSRHQALKSTLEGFNKQFPDIKVTVEDLGNQQVFDKTLAAVRAGGDGLPDIVVSIENFEAEIFWSRFPIASPI
jgi:lactose/L-arabinose transport system substrate-binding protein